MISLIVHSLHKIKTEPMKQETFHSTLRTVLSAVADKSNSLEVRFKLNECCNMEEDSFFFFMFEVIFIHLTDRLVFHTCLH